MISGDEVPVAPGLVGGIAKVGFPSVARQACAVWHKNKTAWSPGFHVSRLHRLLQQFGCFVARDMGHLACRPQ